MNAGLEVVQCSRCLERPRQRLHQGEPQRHRRGLQGRL